VKEQYDYCYKNDLKHVWAYLWCEWYHPEMWKQWAHASTPKLNILRSTMAIEGHWRYNRARLDLIIYIIVVKVIPHQIDRLQLLRNNRCMSKWRDDFRLEWKKLTTEKICSCSSFLLSRFHLCKHLVGIYGPVEPGFFRKVTRQEHYPLLEVKEENAFSDLPENIHTSIKNLNNSEPQVNNQFHEQQSQACGQESQVNEQEFQVNEQEFQVNDQESQVNEQEFQVNEQEFQVNDQEFQIHEQDSTTANLSEYSTDIASDNQDLILFQNRKKEIFNLLDETKNILEKNVADPNKWLDSIEKNFEPLRKLVEDCKHFERKNSIPNTWKNR
ncbi:11316_t:CDS:2, partial [Gigaspora margarita]